TCNNSDPFSLPARAGSPATSFSQGPASMNTQNASAQPLRHSRASRGLAALLCGLLLMPPLASAEEPSAVAQPAAASAPAAPAAPAQPTSEAPAAQASGSEGAADPAAPAAGEPSIMTHDLSPRGMYQ